MKHTSEPWELHINGSDIQIRSGLGEVIAECADKYNADRIVRCVNACAGIENPEEQTP